MYLIVETVRQEAEGDKPEWKSMRQTFRAELGEGQELGGDGWRQPGLKRWSLAPGLC